MWTTENRPRYDRDRLRYPSDLTDEEWSLVEPLIPPAKRGGRRREVVVREVVNGVMYVLSSGCQWRYIPKDLPPRSTLHDYFTRWNYDGTIEKIHYALYVQCREAIGREASPTACVIDSQSVKSAEKGGSAFIYPGMMQARRSRGSGGISWSRRQVCCCTPKSIPRTSRTVTVVFCCFPPCSDCIHSWEAVRRCWLSGTAVRRGRGTASAPPLRRDREAIRPRQRLRRAADALGRRTYLGLAQSLPPPGQGLREPQPQCLRLPPPGVNPPHAAKALQSSLDFPDGL